MSTPHKSVIIGAGVAGLASAIRLAVDHFEVTVFEKNLYPGGKLSHISLGDFHFDSGPSLFVQPENLIELFELAYEPIAEYLTWQKVAITCKYFYENGTVINAYADANAFAEEMQQKVDEDPAKVLSYLRQSRRTYEDIGNLFLNYSLHRRSHLLKAPLISAVKATKRKYIFNSLNQLNCSHFNRPESVQLFNRFATYNGSDPFKAPGMLSLIPHLECNEGVYYPKGGMKSIAESLYRLAIKKGVKVHFNSPVQRIISAEGRVKGVVVNDENVRADVVVSNIDAYHTYRLLLRDEAAASKILKQERSSSAIIFYWGINQSFPELELHNIFFSKDYKHEFAQLFGAKSLSSDPTVYVNITAKMENSQAPVGKENWFVMINAPANYGQNWEALKNQCRQSVINKLSRMLQTDLESQIEAEQTLDPASIEQATAAHMGALYGSSSDSKLAAFLRHSNFSSRIKGLYFAGGTVHPGGGIPLCLKSAKLVSQLVKEDNHKLFPQH